jgi:hypothetical protein
MKVRTRPEVKPLRRLKRTLFFTLTGLAGVAKVVGICKGEVFKSR